MLIRRFLDWYFRNWTEYRTVDGLVMRRRVHGRWETRAPTPEELEDILWWQAIK